MRVVIVGAGAAGLTLASNIRNNDEETEIVIFTKSEDIAYSPCAIPLVLGGCIDSFEDIIMHDSKHYLDKDIQIHLSTSVTGVDSSKKTVTFEKDGCTQTIIYDKLVLATGSEIVAPEFEVDDMDNVFSLTNINDGRIIQESLEGKKEIVFISNMSIGIESAYELARKGYDVTFLEQSFGILPLFLDGEMAGKLVELNEGVNFEINSNVTSISTNGSKKEIHYNDKIITADMVILPSNKVPSIFLAREAGCEIGDFGAVKINEFLETNVEDVYAIGDCVEVTSHVTGTPTVSPAGTTAVRQAIILSNNLAGNKLTFDPVVNTVVSKVGDYNYASSGITEAFANMIGLPVVSACIETCQKARYYPENNKLYVKMICKEDGTIVGCQMLSKGDISSRIDALSFIITDNMKCEEIIQKEFSYTPSLVMVVNPIVQISLEMMKKIKS
ncbi:FAD-dependent oxidoreductase [Methanobrevibacter sp.]|uniref:FAD-dependent oxidoreductase n=1 Tax=Methanobrevibacter sp. TaxID=66852 RepID=UPI002E76F180|nr:FAD-dependent oxidoreductase [Methanobrevibacter sp.]MEE1336846.1 FAD-dependent oxidoreductase [Methanobrevibacter sp.]MEE3490915.1 FAD-dependent oxidoreductase [Methanobrevibacter sp.]